MKYSAMLSLVFAIVGVVLWIEGGPHPRTRAAWLLLVAILIVSALPMLLCWLFSYTAAAPLPGRIRRAREPLPGPITGASTRLVVRR